MIIMQEETLGLAAPIMKISSAEQAVEIANRSELGLIASLWTHDLATAWRVGEALPHGSVNINETSNYWDGSPPLVAPEAAWGVSCRSGSWSIHRTQTLGVRSRRQRCEVEPPR